MVRADSCRLFYCNCELSKSRAKQTALPCSCHKHGRQACVCRIREHQLRKIHLKHNYKFGYRGCQCCQYCCCECRCNVNTDIFVVEEIYVQVYCSCFFRSGTNVNYNKKDGKTIFYQSSRNYV